MDGIYRTSGFDEAGDGFMPQGFLPILTTRTPPEHRASLLVLGLKCGLT